MGAQQTQSHANTNENGQKKTRKPRERKTPTTLSVAVKIAALVGELPADQREKVFPLAKTIIDAT